MLVPLQMKARKAAPWDSAAISALGFKWLSLFPFSGLVLELKKYYLKNDLTSKVINTGKNF